MPTPDFPVFQRGVNFGLLAGDGATPTEVFTPVCIATTVDFDRALDTEDVMMIDCANPQNIPVRQSTPKGQTWDVAFSGKCDFKRFLTIEANYNSFAPHNYQVEKYGTGANGGGIYQGSAYLTALKLTKNDNGMVSFTASLKGQGLLTYTANA